MCWWAASAEARATFSRYGRRRSSLHGQVPSGSRRTPATNSRTDAVPGAPAPPPGRRGRRCALPAGHGSPLDTSRPDLPVRAAAGSYRHRGRRGRPEAKMGRNELQVVIEKTRDAWKVHVAGSETLVFVV